MGRRDTLMPWLAAVASLLGLGVSTYLTVIHFAAIQAACTVSGMVNCERVLSSGYAVVAGSTLPTSAAGIVWFAVSGALAIAQIAARGSRLVMRGQVVWSAVGLLTVLYLVFVEIVVLGAICLWCTAVHALVLVTFLVAITRWRSAAEAEGS
jgi:uncharacterized membrane protein